MAFYETRLEIVASRLFEIQAEELVAAGGES
jgi:hypothetical protein